jgi:hypothetical protein
VINCAYGYQEKTDEGKKQEEIPEEKISQEGDPAEHDAQENVTEEVEETDAQKGERENPLWRQESTCPEKGSRPKKADS